MMLQMDIQDSPEYETHDWASHKLQTYISHFFKRKNVLHVNLYCTSRNCFQIFLRYLNIKKGWKAGVLISLWVINAFGVDINKIYHGV